MQVSQFDYQLPPELIAQTPIEPRHASRLMVLDRRSGRISHHAFTDIIDLLHAGDILIANDSRVIPARLFGRKQSGGKVEILLLKIEKYDAEALSREKRMKKFLKEEKKKWKWYQRWLGIFTPKVVLPDDIVNPPKNDQSSDRASPPSV